MRLFEPCAADAVALLQRAIRLHGAPTHLVTDQGPQFKAAEFRDFVRSQGIKPRYGRVGESHSLGLIDRFFKSLKLSLGVPCSRPWDFRGLADFRRRLELALVHYSYVRPHASLGASTPIETYYGIRGHLPVPVRPPRGRRGEGAAEIPFEILHLDPERQAFPIVAPTAA